MESRRCCCSPKTIVVALAIFGYFVFYPGDLETLLAPLARLSTELASIAANLLQVTVAISPWFYGTVAVGIVAWSATRIWGKPRRTAKRRA